MPWSNNRPFADAVPVLRAMGPSRQSVAIATEDVDSRDWMTPDDPRALTERVARLLGASGGGNTVSERLGRELWIDYLADTGDDATVSQKLAGCVFGLTKSKQRLASFTRQP